MANFYGTARTNYFKVKDVDAFKAWIETLPSIQLIEKNGEFAFYSICPDSGTFPSSVWDEESEDFVDIDLVLELAKHLTEDSIAVLMEAGAEKVRYINGWAVAVNHKGQIENIWLDDIYSKAEQRFGIKPTRAEY